MVDNVNGLNALPIGATANNIPSHIQLLKDDLNGGSIIRRLTGAQIAALSAPEKVAGVVVYNTTTLKLQVSNGSSFTDIDAAALLLAGGTMAGDIAMGSNKVTGLGKGTATGDAMARQQVQSGTTAALAAHGTATLSFSPAFGAAPVVVVAPTGDVETTGSWWVNTVSTTQATLHYQNSTAIPMSFKWIAVGN